METIKNYLENMFATLPKTKEFLNLKNDILANMEDKYLALKNDGKSENEAIGIVISEFGNIDELISEMGLSSNSDAFNSTQRVIDQPEAEAIVKVHNKYSRIIAIGVFLCIMAPAVLVLFSSFTEFLNVEKLEQIQSSRDFFINADLSDALGLIPFFLMIALAVGLFIFSGLQLSNYEYLEKETFGITLSAKTYLTQKKNSYSATFSLGLILGVVLCILSPMPLIVIAAVNDNDMNNAVGVFILLTLIAIAVFTFISVGTKMDIYKKLLQEGAYAVKTKENNRVIGAVAAFVWPLTTVAYLLWSFLSGDWHITWIIWPIVGICFGAFSGAYNAFTEGSKN